MDRVAARALLETLCGRFDAVAISALDPATLPPLMERLETLIRTMPARPAYPPPSESSAQEMQE
jgi:hypothetical protein